MISMKRTKAQLKILLKKINKHISVNKKWLGMGDYVFSIKEEKLSDGIAEITTDYLEKTAVIKLSPVVFTYTEEKIFSVVTHELVHGRYGIMDEKYQAEIESIKYQLEEDFINDLIRWKENVK